MRVAKDEAELGGGVRLGRLRVGVGWEVICQRSYSCAYLYVWYCYCFIVIVVGLPSIHRRKQDPKKIAPGPLYRIAL